MFHSVTICGKNTWSDFLMVPSDGIVLPPAPEQKRTTIDLKTGNGVLDVSTLLTGYPVFQNRSGDLKFYILEPWEAYQYEGRDIPFHGLPSAYEIYELLLEYWHGRKGKMIFEDDPNWYYQGYYTVSNMDTTGIRRSVTIHYEVEPYKYAISSTSIQLTGIGLDYESSANWVNHEFLRTELGHAPVCPEFIVHGTFSEGEKAYIRIVGDHLKKHARAKAVLEPGNYKWADMFFAPDWSVVHEYDYAFGINANSDITVKVEFNKGRL